MTQALTLSKIDNGPIKYWTYEFPSSKEANKKFAQEYILPYLKNYTECPDYNEDPDCFAGLSVYSVGYKLDNGISLGVGGALSGAHPLMYPIVIATKGGKSTAGREEFYFLITSEGFYPWAWKENLTREEILNGYDYKAAGTRKKKVACKKERFEELEEGVFDGSRDACASLLMFDDWEFKDDYPW